MKITFSNDTLDIGCRVEVNKEEIGWHGDPQEPKKDFQDQIMRAYNVVQTVWKEFPEFRQVTLDTTTDEERRMIGLAEKCNRQN